MVFDHLEALGRPAIVSPIGKYGRFFYHMLAFCQFNFEVLIAHKFYADLVFLPRVYECFSSAELPVMGYGRYNRGVNIASAEHPGE